MDNSNQTNVNNFNSGNNGSFENKPSSSSPPQTLSHKRPGEPIVSAEQRARITSALDTHGNVNNDKIEEIQTFLITELNKLKLNIKSFTEDTENDILGSDSEERLNKAVQSLNLVKEIMTFNKSLYSPYFNSDVKIIMDFKCANVTEERTVSPIYCNIVNELFYTNDLPVFDIIPKFIALKVDNKPVVPLNVMNDAIDIYNNILMSKILYREKENIFGSIIRAVQNRIDSITDEELKKLNTRELSNTIALTESFGSVINDNKFSEELVSHVIDLAIKCIKSDLMDKRVFGINGISGFFKNIAPNFKSKNKIVDKLYSLAFPIIFGKNTHINLIKISDPLIKFLFNDEFIEKDDLNKVFNIIWNSIIVNIYLLILS